MRSIGYDLNVRTSGVVLVLAGWVGGVCAWCGWPLPDPVNCEFGSNGLCSGNLQIGFAPLLDVGCRLAWDAVRELLLTLDGDGARVDLVTAPVVKVLGCEE